MPGFLIWARHKKNNTLTLWNNGGVLHQEARVVTGEDDIIDVTG